MKVPYGKKITNLDYVGDGATGHLLDLYLPESTGNPPLIVVSIYGSAWQHNDRKEAGMDEISVPNLFQAGFAVARINHRSSSDVRFPGQLHDVKAAKNLWVPAQLT